MDDIRESSLKEKKGKKIRSNDSQDLQNLPSLLEIKKSIPSECFRSTISKSFQYVALDVFLVVSTFLIMRAISDIPIVSLVMWPIYWFFQGTFFWAIFVLGHDCGHGSFSRYVFLNDFVGTLLHSFILVPYHFWRISHKSHHKNTGNFEKDEIFYPEPTDPKEERKPEFLDFHDNYFFLGLGFLFYLFAGYSPRAHSHLNPWDPMFAPHFWQVMTSLLSWIFMLEILVSLGWIFGWGKLMGYYGIPWLIFASWLVITTFLQHSEPEILPWFSSQKWNYVIGNLSSIDRDYGFFQEITHHIGTHQIHHLFPMVPHYNLTKATEHFQEKFPDLVRSSDAPIISTFIKNSQMFSKQRFFDKSIEVFTFHT